MCQRGQDAVEDFLDRLKTAIADRCAIEREVGSGGMATVCLAEDLELHHYPPPLGTRPYGLGDSS